MFIKRVFARGSRGNGPVCGTMEATAIRSAILCFCVVSLFMPSEAVLGNEDEEIRRMLKDIAQAVDHPSGGPVSGRGDAIVIDEADGERNETHVEFRFKEHLSRSDVYDGAAGEKGALQVIYAVNRENSVSFNGYNATVQAVPPDAFYRMARLDFHPETFTRIHQSPVSRWLTGAAEHAPTVRLDLDSKGILRIESEGEFAGGTKEFMSVFLDTTKGYRLVAWEMRDENRKGRGSRERTAYKAEWQQTGSVWYIKEASFQYQSTEIAERDGEPKTFRREVKISVTHFLPNVPVEDSEFALHGLDLPYGTMIADDITGLNYKYGSGIRGTQKLEGPLVDADFVKRINNQARDDIANAGDADPNLAPPLAETGTQAQPGIFHVYVLLALAISTGFVALVIVARKRVRARDRRS